MGNAHLEKWRSLVDEFRQKAGELEREERDACLACTAADRAKVAEAQQFMESSGIGEALCALVWDVRRYAAWSGHGKPVPPGFTDLALVADHMKDFAVDFAYRGRRYGVTFKERSLHPDPRGDSQGEVYLSAAGETVLGVSMVNRAGAAYDDWHPTTIEAFRPGGWIADLLEMHREHRRAKAAAEARARDEVISRRAAMISLE
ncbi:hypothetical protein [Inquilinus sp. Marseille-Q2685]|uniref:hypothetical protein n=1 Tax=Inquilinus sp. Marseille-Q2685 TaxID=2866581 RepID=UPI001CE3F459|nr:hypothetical protein [Inquilinus sp. Marseille-Q2685]